MMAEMSDEEKNIFLQQIFNQDSSIGLDQDLFYANNDYSKKNNQKQKFLEDTEATLTRSGKMINNFIDDKKNQDLSMSEMIRQLCDSVKDNNDGNKNNNEQNSSQSAGDSRDQMKDYFEKLGLSRSQ